jgi:hypothetical protein
VTTEDTTDDPEAPETPTDREVACFEAGVKFGSLYHQFAGTPVAPDSVDDLARAAETAIENQPHCAAVRVDPRREPLAEAAAAHGYTEFTGEFAEVTIDVERAGVAVRARMAMEEGYPRMRVASVCESEREDDTPEGTQPE